MNFINQYVHNSSLFKYLSRKLTRREKRDYVCVTCTLPDNNASFGSRIMEECPNKVFVEIKAFSGKKNASLGHEPAYENVVVFSGRTKDHPNTDHP